MIGTLLSTDVPDFHKTFREQLPLLSFWLFQLDWLYRVIKLAALPVGAVQIRVEVLALLGPIVGRDVRLLQQLVTAVCERALSAEFTLPI